ncbi:uncharacterized protein LOC108628305 [Ceratina calcarata]|uniref:Uncharacterized protein LOC108628305 n=1 Tax=Ceratina calcarata TaxID=156304 RepID=A0AAJ7J6V3_9HYME|nr:uncharacterized protein LOC108628305 [Ceratina calcarata]
MIASLTERFLIPQTEVEACVRKTKVILDDFISLYVMFETKGENNDSVRRATCTLACCAQAQGAMSGTNIDTATLHNMVTNRFASDVAKPLLHAAVDACAELGN